MNRAMVGIVVAGLEVGPGRTGRDDLTTLSLRRGRGRAPRPNDAIRPSAPGPDDHRSASSAREVGLGPIACTQDTVQASPASGSGADRRPWRSGLGGTGMDGGPAHRLTGGALRLISVDPEIFDGEAGPASETEPLRRDLGLFGLRIRSASIRSVSVRPGQKCDLLVRRKVLKG